METLPLYPDSTPITMEMREWMHPLLQKLHEGISEFTFANLYLFRKEHSYSISKLSDNYFAILGKDDGNSFFMVPGHLVDPVQLQSLFTDHTTMKCVSESQKTILEDLGYRVIEDRNNFDYLYQRTDLSQLSGRKFHKKRNLIKAFVRDNNYSAKPLLDEYLPHAMEVLAQWRQEHQGKDDYEAAMEALEKSWELQLCGGIYYVDDKPVAYTLGEELANGTSFVIHFEKGLYRYKGLFQFINQSFASILPDIYNTINREQDLGDPGLRQAKHSYKPSGYVKKYRAFA